MLHRERVSGPWFSMLVKMGTFMAVFGNSSQRIQIEVVFQIKWLPGFFNHSSQSCFFHSFTNPLPSAKTCPIYSPNFEIGALGWFLLIKFCLRCTSKVKMVAFHSVSVTPVCIVIPPLTIGISVKMIDSHVCISFCEDRRYFQNVI